MVTYQWVSPTGHSDPSGHWVNPANAYDGNWNSYAHNTNGCLPPDYKTNYLTLTLAALMYIDRIRFKYRLLPLVSAYLTIEIDVYNQDTGMWENMVNGGSPTMPFDTQITVIIPTTYTDRLRVRAYLSGQECDLFELDVERVTPDPPAPPPPPPNLPEVYQTKIKETKGQPPQETTRIRTLHRTTRIAPWVV